MLDQWKYHITFTNVIIIFTVKCYKFWRVKFFSVSIRFLQCCTIVFIYLYFFIRGKLIWFWELQTQENSYSVQNIYILVAKWMGEFTKKILQQQYQLTFPKQSSFKIRTFFVCFLYIFRILQIYIFYFFKGVLMKSQIKLCFLIILKMHNIMYL